MEDFFSQTIVTQNSLSGWLIKFVLSALALFAAAYLLRGVYLKNLGTAFIVAFVIGILNNTLGALMRFFALPFTFLTLGLFSLVIDAALILLAAYLFRNFRVDNFWWALLLAVVLALFNMVLHAIYL